MANSKKAIPEYAAQPLRRFLDYWEVSYRLLHLCIQGVSGLRAMPKVVTALAKVDGLHEQDHDSRRGRSLSLEEAERSAEFAKKECESGFPLLHAHTLVGLWGAMEAAIEDSLLGILVNEPAVLQSEAFAKVRVPLAEFECLEKEDRMRLLLNEVARSNGAGGNNGVDMFEALLSRFGLSGKVEPDVKKAIWEMNHVRNIIVHRGSLVDRRLVECCPWLGMKVGESVIVTHERLHEYGGALCGYCLAITYRLGKRYGVDIDAKIQEEKRRSKESNVSE